MVLRLLQNGLGLGSDVVVVLLLSGMRLRMFGALYASSHLAVVGVAMRWWVVEGPLRKTNFVIPPPLFVWRCRHC